MPPPVHVIISTHTPRHLERTLIGTAAQTLPPAGVTVSCDTDDPAITRLVSEFARAEGASVTLVQRSHTGQSRSSQVRNNAVRALLGQPPSSDALLVFLDGDCVPGPELCAVHAALCPHPGRLSVGFRIDLAPEQTDAFDVAALRTGRPPVQPTMGQLADLHRRQARYRRQALFRQLRLAKPHKPKLLSANFALRLDDYLAVNGFDEEYQGYGQEDDDLGRRLYRRGCRPVVAIERAVCFHQHHPTRAPADWHQSPNAARFAAGGPVYCLHGVDNPLVQPDVQVTRYPGGPS